MSHCYMVFRKLLQEQTEFSIGTGFSRGARMRLRDMRRLVETDLRDLQKLLNRNPKTARAELAKRFSKITLTPREAIYVGV